MIEQYLPFIISLAVSVLVLGAAHYWFMRRNYPGISVVMRQVILLLLTVVAIVSIILTLPISETARSDLLGLLGLAITGVFALSSTTFVANAMAGFMLRAVKSFNLGDFISVNDHFGRVSERGLFHTEIQSEDRDLVTLPNLYLTTHSVTVIRASGTVISCELSLGYDVPYYEVEPLLKAAAVAAGLQDPFVQILSLGDHSVTYKAAGLGVDVKHLLTMRTALRRAILDQLHGAEIEIVSPTFVNQRRLEAKEKVLSPPGAIDTVAQADKQSLEKAVFDKAERAENIKLLRSELEQLKTSIMEEAGKPHAGSESERASRLHASRSRIKQLENILRVAKETVDDD